MKRAHPKQSSSHEPTSLEVMMDDGELESAHLKDTTAINCNIAALQLIDVGIENAQFTGAHFSRIVARDTVFKKVDLSSASLENGLLVRVEFVNCRMAGADFSNTDIHDVTFRDCKLDGAIFFKASLRRVGFENCSLAGVDMSAARTFDVEM